MHFTSPIRRYPDLLTQRALIAALEKNERHTDDSIAAVGEHCSEQEVKADKAEWDCRQRLLCAAAKERVGECFSAFCFGNRRFWRFCFRSGIKLGRPCAHRRHPRLLATHAEK